MTLEGTSNSPFEMALQAYEYIDQEAKTDEDMLYYFLEDSIFSSVYATYYEEMLISIKNNPQMAKALIEKFSAATETRDQNIANQAQLHVNYVMNGGHCDGCVCCEDHKDVNELIEQWETRNFEFFQNIYIGMQAIQYAFEVILFTFIPSNLQAIKYLNRDSVFNLRDRVYKKAEEKLHL